MIEAERLNRASTVHSARTDRSGPNARRPVSYYVTILTLMLAAMLGVVIAKTQARQMA
jgi:hypothetical protein